MAVPEKRVPNIQSTADRWFLDGGGELGALMRQRDWSETSLGLPESWPQSLRTLVNILLTSRYAMWVGWGKDLAFLYNDAYRPTLGLKHPWALGAPASKVWAEIWPAIGPRIGTVLSTGQATYDEGLLLFLERSGFPEETYHTFSYSPLADDTGAINGMLCVVTEETERVIGERRITTLRQLASELAAANTERMVLAAIEHQFGANPKDLPFTLTYLFDQEESGRARLVCSSGITKGHPAAPETIQPGAPGELWLKQKPFLLFSLSARAGEESRIEGLDAGADDYLVKPFTARELLARVAAHVGLSRMRQEAAEAVREGENRFRKAFAEAPVGMVLTGAEGQIIEANHAFLDMVGYTLDELVSHDSRRFTHPDDMVPTKLFFESLRRHDQTTAVLKKRYIRRDGQLVWARASATMRHGAKGEPEQLVAIIEDITAQVETEEELRQHERRLEEDRRRWRELLLQTPAAIAVLRGPSHTFEWVNSDYVRLIGWPAEALVGKTVRDALPEVEGQVSSIY